MRAYCIGNFGSVDGVVLDPALTLPRPKTAPGLALAKSLPVIDGIRSRKSCSHQTSRWREQDSNHRFRRGRARRFVCRFSFAPTFRLAKNLTEATSKDLSCLRGTDGSNPVPSSGESGAN